MAVAWLGVAVWVWLTRAGVLLAGHPAYAVAVTLAGVVGAGFAVAAVLLLSGRARTRRRPTWFLLLVRTAVLVVSAVVIGALAYLRPFSASPEAVSLVDGTPTVTVTDAPTRITLAPEATATSALVFQPGARVDPRAYLPLLVRVAEQGHLVVIVKQPFGIGFTALGAPAAVIADHPEVELWSTGGHSLGGVAASMYAEDDPGQVSGLLLWASYPLGDLSARDDLTVSSVSGSEDTLATPADIELSRADLPPTTTFVQVPGAVHAFFGDYGSQPGDGTPTISRADAQEQIVEASTTLLQDVAVP
jgi:hypothetical protein